MSGPAVFTIPLHRPFADALAAGLLARARGDRLALARTLLILPNNRAQRAITDAFVRRADGGLLLPRLVSIGDPDLGDGIGAALDPIEADAIPPAIDPIARRMILARLLTETDRRIDAAEALRLADDLARTLDQLIVEDVPPTRLADIVPDMLSHHWQASLAALNVVLEQWPRALAQRGRIDLADRRNRLLAGAERRWAGAPPDMPIVAAGVNVASPAAARLLRRIARLPNGLVVLAGLDQAMPAEEWDALGGGDTRGLETHPQYALKRLLDRMGVARAEVRRWPRAGSATTDAARGRAIGAAMTPAAFTDKWRDLPPRQRRLAGVEAIALANPALEAQAIAIALRQAIETPGRTAALVTNDRALAARVAADLRRWGIDADDSAGRALSLTPPGTLLLGIADLIAENFAPVPLLALLKHPLVQAGPERQAWLDGVRTLDRALRGPRPAAGLDGVERYLATGDARSERDRAPAREWWPIARARFDALAGLSAGRVPLPAALAAIRETANALAGDEAWNRPAGRAAAELFEAVEAAAGDGPADVGRDALSALLRTLLDGVAVRPPQGGHPRLFIWGLIEARLQQADLMILGGLNEGVWPSLPAPDPWLAPAIRAELGLPGLERRIGSEAEQFAAALGAPRVLLTRARRDARAPAVASRFWLRLEAMTGGIARPRPLARWAEAIDRPPDFLPAHQPKPRPPVEDRPRRLAVTKLDRLKADPYAFYADAMLKLRPLDAIDADPSAAWRGSAVHRIFELWLKEDALDPAKLRGRAEALLAEAGAHPVLRALWTPRLLEAIEWIGNEVAADRAEGRIPIAAERKGVVDVAGITLEGTVDRIDRLPGGGIAVVDYKSGKPPSKKAVAAGYSMQLGLLGLIAELGGFGSDLRVRAEAFEYWSLSSKDGALGFRQSPVGLDKQGQGVDPADFTARAGRVLEEAVARWLTGDDVFAAKLHPEHSPYGDYDQLMRFDEWYGRGADDG